MTDVAKLCDEHGLSLFISIESPLDDLWHSGKVEWYNIYFVFAR